MKILHIAENYAPVGGQEDYIYNVCNELEKIGYENIIVYGIRHSNSWHIEGRGEYHIEGITDYYCLEENNRRLLSIVKEQDPDLIYLHTVENARVIKRLLDLKPIIKYVHNHNMTCPSGTKCGRFFKCHKTLDWKCLIYCLAGNCTGCRPPDALSRYRIAKDNLVLAKDFSRLIVASEYMKGELIKNGIDDEKVIKIPYFVYPPEDTEEVSTSSSDIILFAGRLCKTKGPDYLIKSLKWLKRPYRLVVAGDGYYMNYVKRLAKQMKIDKNIDFAGWQTKVKLKEFYKRASLLVMPSVWPEPFGIVGIEAMSYGKPVVAFNVGGINEWLKEGENGFLVRPKDTLSLAERINRLLADLEIKTRFGENGKMLIGERFSPQAHIDLLKKAFLDAIG